VGFLPLNESITQSLHHTELQLQSSLVKLESAAPITIGENKTILTMTLPIMTTLTTLSRAISWENPLDIEIDVDIDSNKKDYVMTYLDSPELSTIDQQ